MTPSKGTSSWPTKTMSLGVGGEGGGMLVERDCLVAEVESKPPSGLARVRGKVDCFLEMNLGLVEFKNNGGFWGTNLSGVRLLADKAPLGAWLSSNIFFFFFWLTVPPCVIKG
jgi:hypothetical protein